MANWRSSSIDPLICEIGRFEERPAGDEGLISGVLNVDKPAGMTSHDVVNRVRRLAGQRRVGHAGTLDPMATGVLVVCLGQATRLAEYLTRHDKGYRATVRLGQTTDTYDAEGQITGEFCGKLPDRDTIESHLGRFRGEIEQVPPVYSAIKMDGQPLYRRARRGESITPASRHVVIHRLDLMAWDAPALTLEIDCSAGAYIRSLAHDLGAALGCGAHLSALTRLRSGQFRLESAHPLDVLLAEADGGEWSRRLLPMDVAVAEFDALELTDDDVTRISYGQAINGPASRQGELARAYSMQGDFVALVEFDAGDALWHPRKVWLPA
jgi:tRNA pseudouridine55 synthase